MDQGKKPHKKKMANLSVPVSWTVTLIFKTIEKTKKYAAIVARGVNTVQMSPPKDAANLPFISLMINPFNIFR